MEELKQFKVFVLFIISIYLLLFSIIVSPLLPPTVPPSYRNSIILLSLEAADATG